MIAARPGRCAVCCLSLLLTACTANPDRAATPRQELGQAALLTASCSGCHAAGGTSNGIPSLDGMSAAALEARLLAYRDNPDGGSSMHRMARGYSEQQLVTIARTLGDRR